MRVTYVLTAPSSIILVHNHPSHDATPSEGDLSSAFTLRQAGAILGIDLLDQVIVAGNRPQSV